MYSAVPRSLGIAAPLDVFDKKTLSSLISQARDELAKHAEQFSNGNGDLAKGIEKQLNLALDLYQSGKGLPLELNLGRPRESSETPSR